MFNPSFSLQGWRMLRRGVAAVGLALLLGAVPALSTPARAETVRTVAELGQALADALPGAEIVLAPGDYGPLLLRGGGGTEAQPILLRSADPANPARFEAMNLKQVQHLTLQDIRFDYTYADDDSAENRPFQVIDCKGIAIRGAVFDGDLGPPVGDSDDRYPTAFGLSVRGTQGFELSRSEIRLFLRGGVFAQSSDLVLRGNTVHSIRSDGLNFVEVQRVRIEGNTIRDFLRSTDVADHSDMIQFWTNGAKSPSTDITIRDNVLNSGAGLYTQSIFMRNEVVDHGKAGAEMFYRTVTIAENVIINAHLHGITVGETDGLTITRNTVVRNALSSGPGVNPNLWTPQIRVAPASRHVEVTRNVVARITGPQSGAEAQPDWTVADNFLIQDSRPNAPGFFDDVFLSARMGDPRDLSSFIYTPGGPLDGADIGAARLAGKADARQPDAPLSEVGFQPLLRVSAVQGSAEGFVFDATANRFPAGVDPDSARFLWTFDDGVTLAGQKVTRHFDQPGKHQVVLGMDLPDGRRFTARASVTVTGPQVITFAPESGLLGWIDGKKVALDLPGGVAAGAPLPVGAGVAPVMVPPDAMAGFFGARDFELTLRLRAKTARSHGEMLRIHNTLIVVLSQRGLLDVSFSTANAAAIRIRSTRRVFTDTEWHDLTLSYSATTGLVRLLVDGEEVGKGTTTGPVRQMEYWGLSLGNPFGNKKSFDGEVAAISLSANREAAGVGN